MLGESGKIAVPEEPWRKYNLILKDQVCNDEEGGKKFIYNGQANLETNKLEGIGRAFFKDGSGDKSEVYEGQMTSSMAEGFGRTI